MLNLNYSFFFLIPVIIAGCILGSLAIFHPYLIKEYLSAATHTSPLPSAFCPLAAVALSILLKPSDSRMFSHQVSLGFTLPPSRTWCEHITAALC